MILHRFLAGLAVLALPAAAVQAAQTSCMQPAEAQALVTSFLPDIVRSVADACRPNLPGDAFLIRSGTALADRYAPVADAAWPAARPVAVKMVGADIIARLDEQTARKLFAAGIASEIAKSVKAKDCGTVDRILFALEPLPPANVSMLIGVILEAAGRDKKGTASGFDICPAAAAAAK